MTNHSCYIRYRDAPFYLGMDRKWFEVKVRPCLIPISNGKQGLVFYRADLDAWADDYTRKGRLPTVRIKTILDANQICITEKVSDISTTKYMDVEFVKALKQARSEKQKDSLPNILITGDK